LQSLLKQKNQISNNELNKVLPLRRKILFHFDQNPLFHLTKLLWIIYTFTNLQFYLDNKKNKLFFFFQVVDCHVNWSWTLFDVSFFCFIHLALKCKWDVRNSLKVAKWQISLISDPTHNVWLTFTTSLALSLLLLLFSSPPLQDMLFTNLLPLVKTCLIRWKKLSS